MRVVIADDEYLVQETLISMIADCADGWTILGVASDGKELVDLIIQHKPDLAIIDIKMPYITGIEAIKLTKRECPHMQWIILTGYSDFVYAQEAIKLSASNYLLKPVDFAEFKNSLEIAKEAIITHNDYLNKTFESAMSAIGHGLDSGLLEEEVRDYSELDYGMIVFYMDSGLSEVVQVERLKSFYQKVKSSMRNTVDSGTRYAFIFLPHGELALISGYHNGAAKARKFDAVVQQIEAMMHANSGREFCLTMISDDKLSYGLLKERIDKIQTVTVLRILYGVNKGWNLHQLEKNWDDEAVKLCKAIIRLVKDFHEGSQANYINKVNEMKAIMEAGDLFNDVKLKRAISHFISNTIQCPLDEKHSLAEWFQKMKDHGQQLLTHISKAERPHSIIQQALLFIEKNYMKDISILQIADELQVTPNYLSTVFHKKMDTTFIKYLTRIRLIKAQELLRDSDLQVQTVAEMVGYTNPRYFARLFTEFTGTYPSDYKRGMDHL